MKVVIDRFHEKEVEFRVCRSTLLIEPGDIQCRLSDSPRGEDEFLFTCPLCNSVNRLTKSPFDNLSHCITVEHSTLHDHKEPKITPGFIPTHD